MVSVLSVPSFWILGVWRVGTLDLFKRQISTLLVMQLQVWEVVRAGLRSEAE